MAANTADCAKVSEQGLSKKALDADSMPHAQAKLILFK